MSFTYARQNLEGSERLLERALEVLPAAISWSLLMLFVILCVAAPVAGVVAVILFDLYWLLRLLYLTIFLVLSYGLLEIERNTKWRGRLTNLTDPGTALPRTQERLRHLMPFSRERISEKRHLSMLEKLRAGSPDWRELFHLILIPFYREGYSVLGPTLKALSGANYPQDRMVIVLGIEERAGKPARELGERLKREYGKDFFHFEICVHPEGIPGESEVKGANATYAAKWARDFFEAHRTPLEHIIISCFDSDTVVSPEYFACVSYHYLAHPRRTQASFQPIPVYHNNLWEVPAFARVLETGSSFLQLIEATDPEMLVTFSSHSMSFKALVEVGYWPVDLVSDDSAIFWKSFLAFDGNYRVEPLPVTISMDVAMGRNFWETCRTIYQQKRRWAWGVENFPIFTRGLFANPRISLWRKVRHAFRLLEMNVSWAVWTPMMLILSWTPVLVMTREFSGSVAYFNAPRITAVICNLAGTAVVVSIILSLLLLPRRTKPVPFLKKLGFALEWFLLPITATLFGALPALDAQTRLALGWYLEFFITPKRR